MRVHDSQAYRKMDVTREHISRISELREILLSFQTGLKWLHCMDLAKVGLGVVEFFCVCTVFLVFEGSRYGNKSVSVFCISSDDSGLYHSVTLSIETPREVLRTQKLKSFLPRTHSMKSSHVSA